MMYRLLHLSVTPALQPIDRSAIEARLNDLGSDWLGYNNTSWILWTNKSTITVSEMLTGHLSPYDHLLVFQIGTTEVPTGRLPPWMWDWINRPRNSHTGEVQTPAFPAPAAKPVFDPAVDALLGIEPAHNPGR
jgi:hypothetical protein